MSLKAQDILDALKQHGLTWAALSVASTIFLGIVDQFTSRIVPTATHYIEDYWNPPKFFVGFKPSIGPTVAITVNNVDNRDKAAIPVKTKSIAGSQLRVIVESW
jgi:Golgi nucleoside diphosphatase